MSRGKSVLGLTLAAGMALGSVGLGSNISGAGDVLAWYGSENISSVVISEESFPDDAFRKYVSKFDTDNDGTLSAAEIALVMSMNLPFLKVTDMTGIGYFTSLRRLNCSCNLITVLDVSNNTNLEYLDCSCNEIKSLLLKNNTNLKELDCTQNELTTLIVSSESKLEKVTCRQTKLQRLELPSLMNLKYLDCSTNQSLSMVNVSGCKNLTELLFFECNDEDRTLGSKETNSTLLLTGCSSLSSLDVSHSRMAKLDVSSCTSLKELKCAASELESLDLSRNLQLRSLYCGENPLERLSLTENIYLEKLDCPECILSTLDVSKCGQLQELNCSRNQLTAVNVSQAKYLQYFYCFENEIRALNLTNNVNLKVLSCSDNQLQTLNVSRNTDLDVLSCYLNAIEKLDISKCRNILDTVKTTERKEGSEFDSYEKAAEKAYGVYGLYVDKSTELVTTGTPSDPTVTPTDTPTPTPTEVPPEVTVTITPTPTEIITPIVTPVEPTITPIVTPGEPVSPTVTPIDTPTDTPAPTPIVTEAPVFQDFVERLYVQALNRNSEPEGKEFWTNEVVSGHRTGADCARYFLLEAPEFMNRKLSVSDFIETLYHIFFDRDSEFSGKSYWFSEIISGRRTREEVVNNFIESTEWCNVCAKYGVRSGAVSHKAEFASDPAIGFATRLYTRCLNRDPEQDGLNYWSLALTNLEKTGCQAAREFFESEEFQNFNTGDEEYVLRLYRTFMDRTPEPEGFAYWVAKLKIDGWTRRRVMEFFGESPEFTNICASYGIERGTI
ncbi:MAG: DUF4214 domain-containing protein [Clostridiales bacterium]|nr:DUF4214 domain-containing protein [Clostridiales bacterium]